MTKRITLSLFTSDSLKTIWQQGFTENDPEWAKWNAPYYEDYQKYSTFNDFKNSEVAAYLLSSSCKCIVLNDKPIGTVSKNWKDEKTRWLDIGIVIYNSQYWSGGIGTTAIKLWITEIFENMPHLKHVGLTTWSGNQGMIHVAKKLGLKKEAQIRQVRYWQGIYYDSLEFGILRDEWHSKF